MPRPNRIERWVPMLDGYPVGAPQLSKDATVEGLSSKDAVALHRIDRSEPADGLLLLPSGRWRRDIDSRLRSKLPRPVALDLQSVARSVADAAQTYQRHRLRPSSAPPEALKAEARMMTLLRGIQNAQAVVQREAKKGTSHGVTP